MFILRAGFVHEQNIFSSFVVDNTILQKKEKNHFKENYTLRLDTMSNDNGRQNIKEVARGDRKSQPAKVWSINTKYHVVLTK